MGVRELESELLRKLLVAWHLFNGNPSVATKVAHLSFLIDMDCGLGNTVIGMF
jgi:hypothetical protein